MERLIRAVVLFLLIGAPKMWGIDADRGAQFLRDENCLNCHSVRGEGGHTAPDLGRRLAANYTPAALASVVWNHMPAMSPAMVARGVPPPRITDRDAEGLFAYLYSLHFFDNPGEPQRGKQVFAKKNCSACHSMKAPGNGPGAPVPAWKPVEDPLALVQEMWNHSSAMKNALAQRSKPWVTMSGQELADLTAYVQSLQGPAGPEEAAGHLALPEPILGKPLFDSNCRQCHGQIVSLQDRLSNKTLMEIAAGMWNHLPRMLPLPMVAPEDMRKVIAYVWQLQYLGPSGNVGRGTRVFKQKGCAACHSDPATGASRTGRGEKVYTPFSMISLAWDHGVPMLQEMKQKGMEWPQLSPGDISDLVAFINSRP